MFKVYSKTILISIIITLYLFEFCVSLKINDYPFLNILKYTFSGNKFDLRTKFQYYNENKKEFSIQTLPANFLYNDKINIFPLSALSKKKLVHCNENGYMSFKDTDRYSFNKN